MIGVVPLLLDNRRLRKFAGVLKNLVTITRDKTRVTVNTEAAMSKRYNTASSFICNVPANLGKGLDMHLAGSRVHPELTLHSRGVKSLCSADI